MLTSLFGTAEFSVIVVKGHTIKPSSLWQVLSTIYTGMAREYLASWRSALQRTTEARIFVWRTCKVWCFTILVHPYLLQRMRNSYLASVPHIVETFFIHIRTATIAHSTAYQWGLGYPLPRVFLTYVRQTNLWSRLNKLYEGRTLRPPDAICLQGCRTHFLFARAALENPCMADGSHGRRKGKMPWEGR